MKENKIENFYSFMDYYQVLGVTKNASGIEIKKAYRKLAHKYHPDKGGDEKRFKEINEAYQILSDENKKSQYDQFGKNFENANANAGAGFGGFQGGQSQGFDFSGGMGDIGDIFEQFFSGGRDTEAERKNDLRKGGDIEIDLQLDLESILKDQEREILLYKMKTCPRCNGTGGEPGSKIKECFSCRGTGQVQQIKRTILGSFTHNAICPECKGEGVKPEKPCNVCKGEGRIKDNEKFKIFIPAGVDTNQAIKMKGKGHAGKRGGEAGDLYARILIKKHKMFYRRGDDLYITVPISFSQAVLGDKIEIPTLEDKNFVLKVPKATESGKILRISGKGVTHYARYGRGNMFVELEVKIPKSLTSKQKDLLKQLKEQGI